MVIDSEERFEGCTGTRGFRGALTLLGSLVLHGGLLIALTSSFGSNPATSTPDLSPLRFSGTTFDINLLGAPETAAPAASETPEPMTSSDGSPKPPVEGSPPEKSPASRQTKPSPTPREPPATEDSSPQEVVEDAPLPSDPSSPQKRDGSPQRLDTARPDKTQSPPSRSRSSQSDETHSPPSQSDEAPSDTAHSPRRATQDQGAAPSSRRSPSDAAIESLLRQEIRAGSPSGPPGTYGEDQSAPKTVDLYRAFLKTLPLAAKSDVAWSQLPLGPAGELEFVLRLDESSHLLPIEILEPPQQTAPPHLKRAVTHNRNFLLHGRFALPQQKHGSQNGQTQAEPRAPGTQRMRLSAVISQVPADPDTPQAEGVRAFGLRGSDPPTGAYFTFFSGRHVELKLEPIPQ